MIYWQQGNDIKLNCKGRKSDEYSNDKTLEIRHGFCLIYLPRLRSEMDIVQGSVVLVRPQASTLVTTEQGNLRIAENGTRYRYDIQATHSKADNFTSGENAPSLIAIRAMESSVLHYPY